MTSQTRARRIFLVLVFSTGALVLGSLVFDVHLVSEAEARVGRPMTPTSVAGVARRTTRRTIRRSTTYINALPRGCTTVIVDGASLHHCGTTYYQPSGGRYVMVYVD
jgi:hypothetical protein